MEAESVPSTAAGPIILFLKKVFLRHGFPQRIISDRGPAFGSQKFAIFIESRNIKHIMASAEHPQTNGLVDKMNRALVETLAAFINTDHTDWDEKLDQALFAINSAKQSTTQLSPYELVYGRKPSIPLDYLFPSINPRKISAEEYFTTVSKWRKTARKLIISKQKKTKAYVDQSIKKQQNLPNWGLSIGIKASHSRRQNQKVCK